MALWIPARLSFCQQLQNKRISIHDIFNKDDDDMLSMPLVETSSSSPIHAYQAGRANVPPHMPKPAQRDSNSNSNDLAFLVLEYSNDKLKSYTDFRKAGMSKASVPRIDRALRMFWDAT